MTDASRGTGGRAPEASTRAARIAGLKGFDTPSLEAVDKRRMQLWMLTVGLLLALAAALALLATGAVTTPGWLTPREMQVALLMLTALFCAYAIEKELTLRKLTRLLIEERVLTTALTNRVSELSSLLEAGRALNLDLDLRQVLSSILASALELLEAKDASVMLMRSGNELQTVATAGSSLAGGARALLGQGVAGRVAESREPLLINGLMSHDSDSALPWPESAMCTPLIHRGAVLGVLNVNAPQGRRYTEHDLRALSFFAEQAAVAIANAQLLENERLTATQGVFRALHDPLTNLPNRALFLERLRHAQTRRRGSEQRLAVLFMDLQEFKSVNDRYGHAVGDRVLIDIAGRLRSVCRRGDTLSRLGGDEFAILLENIGDEESVLAIAERFLDLFDEPFQLGEIDVELNARLGAVLEAPGWTTMDELLAGADSALRAARNTGEPIAVGRPSTVGGGDLGSEIERAFEEKQFEVHYQPIVRLHSREVIGFEALLRWQHPEHGLLEAASFIQEAERSGLLASIDLWTLEQSCRFTADLGATAASARLHVNLLPTRLHYPETVEVITALLAQAGLPPERLVLEITENHLLLDMESARTRLERLRELGVQIALDDFGSGYSSLSYLRNLPVTMVKMDRLFIQGLAETGPAAPLIEAILRFGQGLALDVVAEGVEHEDQLDLLRNLGCSLGQGFLLARPQPAAQLVELLRG
ncbi:MAG: GGDEF domain-containing protein [Thermoanaerobaculia bacterium]